ncbi:RNA polymerase II transcription initiation [Tubulinosema ratisbonensis]|uniref:General transcription and DNA repair factor IIH subunit TFB4 n=1 Tax=Tubulinosema ratisbonensis TaxID=291195 RepID=A0A437ALW2_9MICR|nr:RNA polymerase II transcription initiation [Tubulinosema ratisbonensis]
MILIGLIDPNIENWQKQENPDKLFSNTLFYFHTFLSLDRSNRILLLNDKKIVFDSDTAKLTEIKDILSKFKSQNLSNDLGMSLLLSKRLNLETQIFIENFDKNLDHFKILRCLFTANKLNIQINVVSDNKLLMMLANFTNGIFYENDSFFVKILGNPSKQLINIETRCFCHDKIILVGLTCPVCLTVYCGFMPVCKKCKSKMIFNKN